MVLNRKAKAQEYCDRERNTAPRSEKAFSDYIKGLPQKEKEDILLGEFPLVLECFNCGTKYSYSKSDVETLFRE